MKSTILICILTLVSSLSFSAFAENKITERTEILKAYYQIADQRPFQPQQLGQFLADNVTDHNAHNKDGDAKASTLSTFQSLAIGAPDSKHDLIFVEDAGKDLVLVYWKFKGTHTGNLLGIPATHKPFNIAGMELYRIKDGKISDIWHVEDIAGLMQQLGLGGP